VHSPNGGAYLEAVFSTLRSASKAIVAEKRGFEPPIPLLVYSLSRQEPVSKWMVMLVIEWKISLLGGQILQNLECLFPEIAISL